MIDDLLPYYNQELINIINLAEQFAKAHPKVASQLHIGTGAAQDPHIGRLIQSFAFLTAHIQRRLDDDYLQVSESLLNIIYPHYLAAIPAFSIVRFECQPDLTTGYHIPKDTQLETTPHYQELCQFSTVYPVTLWPITVNQASMNGLPLNAPTHPNFDKAVSVIKIALTCANKEMTFSKLGSNTLTFHIDGTSQDAHLIYELLFNNCQGIALASSANDPNPIFLDNSFIQNPAFDQENSLLPFSSSALIGYRLLAEFFAFQEKFLFFELSGLTSENLTNKGNKLELFFYLNRRVTNLERSITKSTFQLGCTPIVNLFTTLAEPIQLDQTSTEYPITPDARRPKQVEIYSIENVSSISKEDKITYSPFYGNQHTIQTNHFWHITHKSSIDSASSTYISFTDADFNFTNETDQIISIEAKCSNGNLPSVLPFGAGEPYLQLSSAKAPLLSIQTLIPFTNHHRPRVGKETTWKLISHLSLNYLSLCDSEKGKESLQEMLRLYNIKGLFESNKLIDSIIKVNSRRITARNFTGFQEALCQGTEITVKFDETAFVVSGLYLFSQILENFFANYTSLNSFTKLIVKSTANEGILYQWPPRAGNKILL
jgi:type VI secretion system protein ImpG